MNKLKRLYFVVIYMGDGIELCSLIMEKFFARTELPCSLSALLLWLCDALILVDLYLMACFWEEL